jgi:hypothetical protein
MSYLKLLNARRKSGEQPTMKPAKWTEAQRALAAEGKCIRCGVDNVGGNSYLCHDCQGGDTIEDIRDEIDALRRKLLGRPGGS